MGKEPQVIKGLYFKLNIDNPRDEYIYRFFTMQPDSEKIDKIALLDKMIHLYIKLRMNKEYGMMCQEEEKE